LEKWETRWSYSQLLGDPSTFYPIIATGAASKLLDCLRLTLFAAVSRSKIQQHRVKTRRGGHRFHCRSSQVK
jgi:hypothetical protein